MIKRKHDFQLDAVMDAKRIDHLFRITIESHLSSCLTFNTLGSSFFAKAIDVCSFKMLHFPKVLLMTY